MKKTSALFLILLALLLPAQSNENPDPQPFALTHVTLIDVAGGTIVPDVTVLITGNRIAEVGKSDHVAVRAGTKVVNAEGKFLIPGLWDMHVHWYDKHSLPLFTANGVTGIRQMFGTSDLLRWRQELADGSFQGPRMIVASPILDGPRPFWPNSIAVG
ncbi:MAG TPA: amidohydrolase, partial [Nitrospirota bacterium]